MQTVFRMSNTPKNLRSRLRSDSVNKIESSLSVNFVRSDKAMAPKVDSAVVDACITKVLSNDDIIDSLVTKISDRLRKVIDESISTALRATREELTALKENVTALTEQVKTLDAKLQHRTDDLEQYQRRTNLRVFGIPEKPNEDTDQLVLEVFKSNLKLDTMTVEQIQRSHRVGKKQPPDAGGVARPRPIIVRFAGYRERRRVFEKKRLLKGTNITIKEDLTKFRLELYKAAAARYGFANVWSSDGIVKWIVGDGERRVIRSAVSLSDLD